MSDAPNRNARCHCGSGKKFKNCHGAAPVGGGGRKLPVGYILVGAAILAVAAFALMKQTGVTTPPGAAPPGKVWSAEHGHWHDAP
jgi:uncharacterized protein YecA (UPF0149 family)